MSRYFAIVERMLAMSVAPVTTGGAVWPSYSIRVFAKICQASTLLATKLRTM